MYAVIKGMKHKELGDQLSPVYYRKACCLIETEQQVFLLCNTS